MGDKVVGRGRGRYSAAGVGEDVEARLTALEDYLADQIEAGYLQAPETEEEPVEEDTETPA